MSAKIKYGLSAAVLALITAGASAPQILDQFLDEKEGNHTTAYRDGSGIWTICRGAIMVDGKPVIPGMKLSKEKCDQVNAIERDKALAWVERNIKVPLTEPQKAGIASFCPYNIGPGKCFPSTFYKRLNAGDRKGAASINDVDMTVIPGETLAELNALSGPAVSLVVFSSGYRPRRGDRVVYDGQHWTVTRHERFNGKPMIFIE